MTETAAHCGRLEVKLQLTGVWTWARNTRVRWDRPLFFMLNPGRRNLLSMKRLWMILTVKIMNIMLLSTSSITIVHWGKDTRLVPDPVDTKEIHVVLKCHIFHSFRDYLQVQKNFNNYVLILINYFSSRKTKSWEPRAISSSRHSVTHQSNTGPVLPQSK